jgi:hypothetical protein
MRKCGVLGKTTCKQFLAAVLLYQLAKKTRHWLWICAKTQKDLDGMSILMTGFGERKGGKRSLLL